VSEIHEISALDRATSSYSLRDDDAMLHAVLWLTRHYRRERSAAYLLAGMNVSGEVAPDQAVEMLKLEGFEAGLVQMQLSELQADALPAVALLKHRDACIIRSRLRGGGGFEVILPGPTFPMVVATEAELAAEYIGLAMLASPGPASPKGAESARASALSRRLSRLMRRWASPRKAK
jgi:ATP-binding cassette subfamily C protein LapB